ncbi:hypothetical protein [Streptomyces sp. XD-27]|uniref:hypothetical protein n=1 Tax=Streptomyces sp. XD-27 TaxID=3062779 RepID=UPI0026F46C81|nr:hypothetical protein [Streptomyces sp. XD-27]WKX68629.1 hypothetical protein Q3Y56_00505 [Streptomyces sp. XD-27]
MESMTAAEPQEVFGISRADWRRLAADPGMIKPIDPKYINGETKWSGHGFVRWLAAEHPDLAGQQAITRGSPGLWTCGDGQPAASPRWAGSPRP